AGCATELSMMPLVFLLLALMEASHDAGAANLEEVKPRPALAADRIAGGTSARRLVDGYEPVDCDMVNRRSDPARPSSHSRVSSTEGAFEDVMSVGLRFPGVVLSGT